MGFFKTDASSHSTYSITSNSTFSGHRETRANIGVRKHNHLSKLSNKLGEMRNKNNAFGSFSRGVFGESAQENWSTFHARHGSKNFHPLTHKKPGRLKIF